MNVEKNKTSDMVKGNEKDGTVVINQKNVGFALVKLKAVNPSREQVNELLGKEDDKEITYLAKDAEGNDRVRLSFWLYCSEADKYFIHSFNLTNKVRKSRDGVKTQYVNSSCSTAWGEKESDLPVWFTHHVDKEGNKMEKKKFRPALLGEEELTTLIKSWLGNLKWKNLETSVMIDTEKLFEGDYSELRQEINGKWDRQFIILTGVRTDENDIEKKYQQVYGKAFLPGEFDEYIKNGMKFPATKNGQYASRIWDKFEKDVIGQYGFSAYFELDAIKPYDASKDPAASVSAKADVTATNAKF